MHNLVTPFLGLVFITGALSVLVSLVAFLFWIWMLIDAIQNPRLEGSQRVVWVLVIVLLPCLGSLIYYFAGRSK
jgi:hypothetical protein